MGKELANSASIVGENPVRNDRLLTVEELAEFLNLSVGTIYHLVSQHRVPFVRLSARCLRFQMDVILAWIDQKAEKGEKP